MGKVRDQLRAVRFHCRACGERFQAEPDRIEDAPQDVWHPWRYFAACPVCRTESTQEQRERTLLKMWANATGPKTPEGKAASAANLEGHPTPEEAVRTRFNALQHGLTAKVATYYPARPGRYPQCTGCEYIDYLCSTQTACLKRTELFLRHHVAFQTRNPTLLVEVNADLQANVRALIEDMILSITQDGARLKSPKFYYDNDGGLHWVRMIDAQATQFAAFAQWVVMAERDGRLLVDGIGDQADIARAITAMQAMGRDPIVIGAWDQTGARVPGYAINHAAWLDVAPDIIDYADPENPVTTRPVAFAEIHRWAGWGEKQP